MPRIADILVSKQRANREEILDLTIMFCEFTDRHGKLINSFLDNALLHQASI
jgi:hypothetical protein